MSRTALKGTKMQKQVAQLLPTREGHFVFESGHHGHVWLDLELLFLRPDRMQPLAEALADRLRGYQPAFLLLGAGAGPPCDRSVSDLVSDPKTPRTQAS